jgi:predicted GTPase
VAETFARYPHLGPVLPALGYSAAQRRELRETIARSGADVVVDASPSRLDRFLDLPMPIARVRYRFEQRSGPLLLDIVAAAIACGRSPS